MKKIIYLLLFLCSYVATRSQSDTLYTKNKQKIACKIIEINDVEVKYRLAAAADGPMYVLHREKLMKYTLSNGITEVLVPDEMLIENQHAAIMDRRTVVKISPFSFVNSQISFAYEKVLKVGTNLDVEAGYVNNNINYDYPLSQNYYYGATRPFYTGAYIKPGVKFFVGQDFSLKGMRYAHPLKGRYIKLDLAASFLKFDNIQMMTYTQYNLPPEIYKTNVTTFAYGAFVNYGRQFILGNILTLEYYIGVGFTSASTTYSNAEYKRAAGGRENFNVSNYHGFMRTPGLGISGTAGFRIGYILPERKAK